MWNEVLLSFLNWKDVLYFLVAAVGIVWAVAEVVKVSKGD